MKHTILSLLFCFLISPIFGQTMDEAKMKKDLEVAENVLSTIIEGTSGNRFFWRNQDNISSRYNPDYGVVFTVSNRFPGVAFGTLSEAPVAVYENSDRKGVLSRGENKAVIETVIADGEKKGDLKDAFKTFLKDYNSLIRQLKPSHKIMVKTRPRDRSFALVWAGEQGKKRKEITSITVEAKKNDLDDYSKGSISEKELEKRFIVKESSSKVENEPEIEVFSSILKRLYGSDLSKTYYMSSSPWYERTEGFGLTYYLKYYSSSVENGMYFLPTINVNEVDKAERNKIVDEMYDDFLDGLKENIIEYGHLLKSLKSTEMIVFNTSLTECKDCKMPEEIELSIKKSVIDQYRDGDIHLDFAKKEMKVQVIK